MRQRLAGETRWCWRSSQHLAWCEWQDGFVAFQLESGETHYLNDIAAALIRNLAQTDCSTTEAITASLSLARDPSSATAAGNEILELLYRLEELGLVTRQFQATLSE